MRVRGQLGLVPPSPSKAVPTKPWPPSSRLEPVSSVGISSSFMQGTVVVDVAIRPATRGHSALVAPGGRSHAEGMTETPPASTLVSTNPVLVGIDGSEHAHHALAWAVREAGRRGCGVTVVHAYLVAPPVSDVAGLAVGMSMAETDAVRTAHQGVLDQAVQHASLFDPDVKVEPLLCEGAIADVLVEVGSDTALTVVGTKGTGALMGFLLGSVSHTLAAHSAGPVVVVPAEANVEGPVKTIAVGVDGSAVSMAALQWAIAEAQLWSARLIVIHAWHYPYVGAPGGMVDVAPLVQEDASSLLDEAIATVGDNVQVERRLVHDSAVHTLLDIGSEADLVVVGSHGKGVVRSVVLGSVTQSLLHHATCPVAVVKDA
jgi:nucleotide-binding universal stress UspA family protein